MAACGAANRESLNSFFYYLKFRDRKIYGKSCGIYCIVNLENGRKYIGQTRQSFSIRFGYHQYHLRHGDHHSAEMQQDFLQYGEDSFEFVVLDVCTDAIQCDELERRYISLEACPYNILRGGEQIYVLPEDERKRRKNHKTANKPKPEYTMPEEIRAKMTATRTGKPYTVYSKSNVIDDYQALQIKKLLMLGKTMADVAKETGVSYSTVNNIVSNNAWKHICVDGWDEYRANRKVKHRLNEEDAMDILEKYGRGISVGSLAEEFGKCRTTIQNIIRRKTFA